MMSKLNTPVLFLVFNRLETTKKVFEEIKKAKPSRLFIAADGPRNEKEKEKTDSVRKYILDNVDWKCEVKKLFREENLGCKYAVSSAIDWFFENVEQGIILEDDCLPSQSFFKFCEEMLERYKNNNKIMQISGTNVEKESDINKSYFFTDISNIWGWATWKRAWKEYDVEMKKWEKYRSLKNIKKISSKNIISSLMSWRIFELVYRGKIDTWDYQWDFSIRINQGLVIIPKKNMISNLGLGMGTHTTNYGKEKFLEKFELNFPLSHPLKISIREKYEKAYSKFFNNSLLRKIFRTIPLRK